MMIYQDADQNMGARLRDYASVIDVGIRFAFQPLVKAECGTTSGHEALVRGLSGECAGEIIAGVRPDNLFYFDQACRIRAILDADEMGLAGSLHLNCTEVEASTLDTALSATIQAVSQTRLAPEQIVLEFNSLARLGNPKQLANVRARANQYGFRVLADNFGLGDAGLKRLAVFGPEFIKLDRELISGVHRSRRRQAMVHGIIATCRALDVVPMAAGIEQAAEADWLRRAGVEHFQGYYFARPQTEVPADHYSAALTDSQDFNLCAA